MSSKELLKKINITQSIGFSSLNYTIYNVEKGREDTRFLKCFRTKYQMLLKNAKLLSSYNIGFDIAEKLFVISLFLFDNLQASVNWTKFLVNWLYAFGKIWNRANNYAQLLRQSEQVSTKYQNQMTIINW